MTPRVCSREFFAGGGWMSSRRSGKSGMRNGLTAIALVLSMSSGCGGERSSQPSIPVGPLPVADAAHSAPALATVEAVPGPFRCVDICPDSGVDFFVHVSGMTPQKLSPTANGSGVAVFDFDSDGKLDLYFATGNVLPLSAGPDARNRRYKNLGDSQGHCRGLRHAQPPR
jgi:hypothetical protein